MAKPPSDAKATVPDAPIGRDPHGIYVGTSGWAYTTWKPDFYPAGVSAKKFLEYYATQLNSVEVNYTFRSLPTADQLKNWLAAAGPDFRFTFKAPQRITHILRLKNCADALAGFYASLEPVVVAQRMGLVLFQLPPNSKADGARLDDFLQEATKSGLRLAFEFRNESWFCDEVYAVLRSHKAAMCVAESDDLQTPDVRTADFACYRLRKSAYSSANLAAIAHSLNHAAKSGDVFAYFKHEDEPTGALNAAKLLRELGRAS